ncbi:MULTISPECIES: hypothetical protein [unclassified Gordonia (in: high G+C Gram-positive bacteria)]|uniref:hypothetical protein n=1 Tax=unclassified Gordonia (in: high G+C Gram-positive bacteria) TaxID=2657482 RepID=UPI001965C4D4|nr:MULTISPECIES: hypothetical protein [unclassified Gordonia (in: high G+C Gram-positive bacteria)]MBN0974167.1 hypothetical protein [Gordonia sp. BP-119]MBN0983949.1 hypothetical protein [Gordonia sp. BP-94]
MLELEPTGSQIVSGRWQFNAARVGALVIAAAAYAAAFGEGISTAIDRYGQGASTQPFSWSGEVLVWLRLVVASGALVGLSWLILRELTTRPWWWSWPQWTRRPPLSRSTYVACVSVYVLSVYATLGLRWLVDLALPALAVDDTSTTAQRPLAAAVIAGLRAGFGEEVFVVAVPIAALAMWLPSTRVGLIAALCVLVPMRLAYHVYYGAGLWVSMGLWAVVSAYMVWRWRDYRLVIGFALAHAAYNICEGYALAFWGLVSVAAAGVVALALTHRVRTGRWITMAPPLRAPAPVRV